MAGQPTGSVTIRVECKGGALCVESCPPKRPELALE